MERNSLTPLYKQLASALRRRIEAGEFNSGEAIPAESQLVQSYQVSRITVRKALDLLVNDGMIVRQQGKGTYVRPSLIKETLTSLQGFAEVMVDTHPEQVMEVIAFEFIQASQAAAKALAVKEEARLLRIVRRHILDGSLLAHATIFLPYDLGRLLTVDEVSTTPIYKLLQEKGGVSIKRATQTIRAVVANADMAAALQTSVGSPLLSVNRRTFSAQEIPVEYIELLYQGNRHEFALELYRNPEENLLRPVSNVVRVADHAPTSPEEVSQQ